MRIFSKKSLISIFPLLFLLTFLKPPVAKADVLTPGEKSVDYCFQITNIDKYPDYLIVALVKSENPSLPQSNQVLNKSECLGLNGYREYGEIYALKKSYVNLKEDINVNQNREELKNFASKKANLIPAQIYPIRYMPESYQVDKVADILEITDINNKSLILTKREIIYTYNNGESEKKVYIDQKKRPQPSKKNTGFLWIAPVLGISLIGGFVYWNKSNNS